MKVEDVPGGNLDFRCRTCGARKPVRALMSDMERGMFLPRVNVRKQFAALRLLALGRSVDDIVEDTEISLDSARVLHASFVNLVATHQETENDHLRVGGYGVECEADEIAFRCKAEESAGEWVIVWLRYFGLVRRGSSKVYIGSLPDRAVAGD